MRNNSRGQSVIEAVFLLGALALVLSGAVVLLLSTVNSRTKGFDRKKATELAVVVMEEKIALKNNDPNTFWLLTPENGTKSGFDGYSYNVSFAAVPVGVSCVGQCTELIVTVGWQRDTAMSVSVNRLFSR